MLDDPEVDQQTARDLGVTTALYVPLIVHGHADRCHRSSRQGGKRPALHRRGRPPRRVARDAGGDRRRPLRSASAGTRCAESSRRRSSSAGGSPVSCTTRPGRRSRRSCSGSRRSRTQSRRIRPRGQSQQCASSSCRRCRASGASPSSCGRRRSTTSGSFPRSSGSRRRSAQDTSDRGRSRGQESVGERLPAEVETTLYRIVQEALTNVVKHAGATRVSILLARKERAVVVVVEDDGDGFDPRR